MFEGFQLQFVCCRPLRLKSKRRCRSRSRCLRRRLTSAACVLFPFMAFLVLKSEIVSAALNDAALQVLLAPNLRPLVPRPPFSHAPASVMLPPAAF